MTTEPHSIIFARADSESIQRLRNEADGGLNLGVKMSRLTVRELVTISRIDGCTLADLVRLATENYIECRVRDPDFQTQATIAVASLTALLPPSSATDEQRSNI